MAGTTTARSGAAAAAAAANGRTGGRGLARRAKAGRRGAPLRRGAGASPRDDQPRLLAQRSAAAGARAASVIAGTASSSPAHGHPLSPPAAAAPARASVSCRASAAAGAGGGEEQFLGVKVSTLKKVVPLGVMFFCILFNYTILRDTKDVLVVTAPGSGAEIIPFLKTWVNLPMAIGFMTMYVKLSDMVPPERLFYICILPFIAFFGSFAYVLYPLRDLLHPTQFCENLLEVMGPRFAGPIAILRNWTFCLFYVMAELWGSVVVSVLFWGFANQITEVEEAKQFYPLFGLGANVALIFSGRAVVAFSQLRAGLPPGVDGWLISLKGLMGLTVIGGLIVVGIYWALNRTVVPSMNKTLTSSKPKKKKTNMSIAESFKFLASQSYVRDLALLVVAYGISINLVEVTWKSKIKAQFPNPNDYSAFMGNFSTFTGIATFTMMLVGRWIFKAYGWGMAARITPTVILVTGAVFFALVLSSGPLTPVLAAVGMTPLYAAVLVGAGQNIFSKSAKYSLFDPCKEMAYIPLDAETKVKGKAAIDVVCNPLGKSGGALIQQFMIFAFGSLSASTPYLGVVLLGIVLMWFRAANSLDKQFTALQEKDIQEKSAAAAEAANGDVKFTSTLDKDKEFIEGKYEPVKGEAAKED